MRRMKPLLLKTAALLFVVAGCGGADLQIGERSNSLVSGVDIYVESNSAGFGYYWTVNESQAMTVWVTNNGDASATDVSLSIEIPNHFSRDLSVPDPWGWSCQNQTSRIDCVLTYSMAAGSRALYRFALVPSPNTPIQSPIYLTASDSAETGTALDNNVKMDWLTTKQTPTNMIISYNGNLPGLSEFYYSPVLADWILAGTVNLTVRTNRPERNAFRCLPSCPQLSAYQKAMAHAANQPNPNAPTIEIEHVAGKAVVAVGQGGPRNGLFDLGFYIQEDGAGGFVGELTFNSRFEEDYDPSNARAHNLHNMISHQPIRNLQVSLVSGGVTFSGNVDLSDENGVVRSDYSFSISVTNPTDVVVNYAP